jgi:uroporphyrinogen-III decarboxylase
MNRIPQEHMQDFTPSPEYLAREKRVRDALELRRPDRIPILMGLGYLTAEMGHVTRQELYENPDKAQEIFERLAQYFQPDMIFGLFGDPQASKVLGDQMTKWPGYGMGPNGSFQFDEKEFMKAEDYDALLEDPSDYAVRTYLPRAFSKLKGLSMLPPLGMSLFGYYNTLNLSVLSAPPVVAAIDALQQASQAVATAGARAAESSRRMARLGFPPPIFMAGCLVEAPFDFMSDTLRGMRGIFLDMLRIPDKLLASEEKVKRFMLKHAVATVRASGIAYAGLPLHRGSDGFMSLKQFETFYWPQLKDLMLRLIDAGITPWCFYEGVWDQRLEYLLELPKGKTFGFFQSSDIFKVKEVLGDTMCIFGGMPISMLTGGNETQIREHTHELCERVGRGGGYIMTTGVLELEGCKPELIKTWVDAVKEYGEY